MISKYSKYKYLASNSKNYSSIPAALGVDGELDEDKDRVDQKRDPPCQQAEQIEENHDGGRGGDEDALAYGDRENLSRVPCVDGQEPPEEEEQDGGDGTDGEEEGGEEGGERLDRRGQGTDAKEDNHERRHGEESGEADAEEEGRQENG